MALGVLQLDRFFVWILAISLAVIGGSLMLNNGFESSKYAFRFYFGESSWVVGAILILLGLVLALSDLWRR